tara:strand:+ start:1886 stop:2296 length:411 start_codon:yes stop_codon:yes gene_type:complete
MVENIDAVLKSWVQIKNEFSDILNRNTYYLSEVNGQSHKDLLTEAITVVNNAIVSIDSDEQGWKPAYQFEHEEHKKTLLMLKKTMDESDQIFVKTRDIMKFLEELSERQASLNSAQNRSHLDYLRHKETNGGGVPL